MADIPHGSALGAEFVSPLSQGEAAAHHRAAFERLVKADPRRPSWYLRSFALKLTGDERAPHRPASMARIDSTMRRGRRTGLKRWLQWWLRKVVMAARLWLAEMDSGGSGQAAAALVSGGG
jgi:ferric-dicitrate binding protein FerR (iron transport regulator)